jgi:ribosomal protein L7/L12
MPLESLNCPNCGAPLPDAGGAATVVCAHCRSTIRLRADVELPRPPAPPAPAPAERPERSALTSVALGPEDVAEITRLLRERQKITAVQLYHAKVGGTLGEAKEAVEAIEAGLRDASAPLPPPSATPVPGGGLRPSDLPEIHALVKAGKRIDAVKRVRELTGLGLREALTVVEGVERQMGRAVPSATSATWRGCASMVGVAVLFLLCTAGGCGAYLQTKPAYGCSIEAVKAAVADQDLLRPPINAGYLVLSPGYEESAGFGSWELHAEFFTPVWGADGFGVAYVNLADSSASRAQMSARVWLDGERHDLLPWTTLRCE